MKPNELDWRYKEQQDFFNDVAERLGVVCFRPEYHAKKGDANTVLFYTKEDEAHNRMVDRQPIQYSRTQAADSRCHIDDKYIYRDYFWNFENTDVNGMFDYGFGNFGRLDLRGSRWEDTIEGDIRIALVKKKERDYIRSCGGVLAIPEADDSYNSLNRKMIAAVKMRYGKCFLGNVNFYGEKRRAVADGKESPLEEYTGQMVYNFGCAFCVPEKNEELEALISEWNRDGGIVDGSIVPAITELVQKIGGVNFIWV